MTCCSNNCSFGLDKIKEKMKSLCNPDIAVHSQRFFKTGKGEYGEGDIFLGIRVPVLRKLAKEFSKASLKTVFELLKSKYHEERQLALFILVNSYKKSDADLKVFIYNMYLDNTMFINNWDLVDSTAEHIVGEYLYNNDREVLFYLAKSDSLWERRISIISTFYFIRRNDFADTLKIAELLINDKEDLIHKAVGWMLREVGNRNLEIEENFLQKHYNKMPRTMLRYAIEKFEEDKRQKYLKGLI